MVLQTGSRFGSYEVLALIGRGGMGEVYRARDSRLGRDVALKVLPETFVADPDRLSRFEREARLLASLNHPHIAAIHGVEDVNGVRGLVLEFVPGRTLADLVSSSALPLNDAMMIARQIADALDAAHERGIIHRDLKPANIKITADGTVKVLDFGLAKALSDDVADLDLSHSPTITAVGTQTGVILGTAAYMSPEQARGRAVDKRADIWAFGCLLFEMLTGKPLFGAESVSDVLASILTRPIDWQALPSATPPAIRRLLQRCLERDSRKRLRDIGDARIEIDDALLTREPVEAARPGLSSPRVLLPAAALIVGLVALAAAAAIFYRNLTTSGSDRPVVRMAIIPPVGSTFDFSPGRRMELSPDGRYLAFAATGPSGRTMLWIRALDKLEAVAVPETEGVLSPFWSPDSRTVGFFSGESGGQLKQVSVAGGPVLPLADFRGAPAGATWSRDDVILLATTGLGLGIQRVAAAGGALSQVTKPATDKSEGEHFYPYFLPDGRHFLYLAVGSINGSTTKPLGIYVADLDSDERKLLVPGGSNAKYANGYLFFLREATLLAQRFDAGRLEFEGEPIEVATRVLLGGSTNTAGAFSVSETGVIAYQEGSAREIDSELQWLDRKGNALGKVGTPQQYAALGLSPDDRRLAAEIHAAGKGDLWIFDLIGGNSSRFTFDGLHATLPVWAPDGSRIAFRKNPANMGLYTRVESGAGADELIVSNPGTTNPTDWTPDSRFIIYQHQNPDTGWDLSMVPVAGDRKPSALVQTKSRDGEGRVSPNGRFIAFSSEQGGAQEVYVRPFPNGPGEWQVSIAGGEAPRWRRDGKELFYISGRGSVMAAEVETTATFEPRGRTKLFDAAIQRSGSESPLQYAVTANGQRFLIPTPVSAATPINVILNWSARTK